MILHEAPDYLTSLLPPPRNNMLALRNQYNLPHIYCRTNLYSNSFLPATIRLWNSLDSDVKNEPTVLRFKRRLTWRQKQLKYYNAGTRMGSILHTRIRLNCSNLQHHLYLRYITEDQRCQCGWPSETAEHYLLHCPLHKNERMLYIPVNLTPYQLLHGDESKTYLENVSLFENVQKFILESKRFA